MKAPFSEEQIEKIKEHQECPYVHPLTCPICGQNLSVFNFGLFCQSDGYLQDFVPDIILSINYKDLEKSFEGLL